MWTVPAVVENPAYIYNTLRSIVLQTYIAQDPVYTTALAAYQYGWFCNAEIKDNTGLKKRTQYPEFLTLDYPEIPDSLRKELTYTSNSTFNVAIPNDFLEVSF